MTVYSDEWKQLTRQIRFRELSDPAAARLLADWFKEEWTAACEKWSARHWIRQVAFLDPSVARGCVEWLRTQRGGFPDDLWHYTGTEAVPREEFLERLDRHALLWGRTRLLSAGSTEALEDLRQELDSLPRKSDRRPALEAILVLAEALRSPESAAERVVECSDALGHFGRWVLDEVAWRFWLFDPESALRWLRRASEQSMWVTGTMGLIILHRVLRDRSQGMLEIARWLTAQLWRGGQGYGRGGIQVILDALPLHCRTVQEELLAIAAAMLERFDVGTAYVRRWLPELREELQSLVQLAGSPALTSLTARVDELLAAGDNNDAQRSTG